MATGFAYIVSTHDGRTIHQSMQAPLTDAQRAVRDAHECKANMESLGIETWREDFVDYVRWVGESDEYMNVLMDELER